MNRVIFLAALSLVFLFACADDPDHKAGSDEDTSSQLFQWEKEDDTSGTKPNDTKPKSSVVFQKGVGYIYENSSPSETKTKSNDDGKDNFQSTKQEANSLVQAIESLVIIETKGGSGSGFIIDSSGRIVTNYHVVEDSQDVIVRHNDMQYKGIVGGWDQYIDIAIIIPVWNHTDFSYLGLNEQTPQLGSEVFSLGFPLSDVLGRDLVVTKGIISSSRNFDGIKYLQTDAPLNPGSSGGPLIDEEGNLLGVATSGLKQLQGQSMEGISFALNISELNSRFTPLTQGTRTEDPSWCSSKTSSTTNVSKIIDWGVAYKGWVSSRGISNPQAYAFYERAGLSDNPLERVMQTQFLIDGELPILQGDKWFAGHGIDPLIIASCGDKEVSQSDNPYKQFFEKPGISPEEIGHRYDAILGVIESSPQPIDSGDPSSIKEARWRQRFLTSDAANIAQKQLVALVILDNTSPALASENISILETMYNDWVFNADSGEDISWMRYARNRIFPGFGVDRIFKE